MSSDRGTISRDAGSWSEPTAPAGRRLPSAPRERKPVLAALAVLLVVGGALAAALLVTKAGHTTGAVEISTAVGQGQKIPATSLKEVQINSGAGVNYVPWDEESQVTRTFAATELPAGTLLTPQMTTSSNNLVKGMTVVELALKDGQLPGVLQVGDHVNIYETSDGSGRCPRPVNDILSSDAVITAVSTPPSNSSEAIEDVQIAVKPGDAGGVSCNAANSNVGVGILPNAGQGAEQPSYGNAPSSGSTSSGATG
jgi:hypothetical protein